ncbi:MAG: restriction endonuclease subunit S, partial [Lactococcus raffinolactis]|nr:restriction endonuclease subunit S [Lactococcus raffinolactis]
MGDQNKNVPRLRFPGYTDAWVKCKLGDVGKTFTGLSGKTKEDFGHGEGKFVVTPEVFDELNK